MSEFLNAKCNQVPVFAETLKKHNKAVVFAETTFDDFWATGLDKDATIHTVATAWPGDNKLGSLMTEITARLRLSSGRSQSIPRTKSNRKTKSYETADLSHLKNELKTPRKRNCSGNRKLSPKSQVTPPKSGGRWLILCCFRANSVNGYGLISWTSTTCMYMILFICNLYLF